MAKFIQLRAYFTGNLNAINAHLADAVYTVNVEYIVVINKAPHAGFTLILMREGIELRVAESVEEILAKIKDGNDD